MKKLVKWYFSVLKSILITALLSFVWSAHAASGMLNFTAGQVGILDGVSGSTRYGLEYRERPVSRWAVNPVFGYARAQNGASFLYTGIQHDFWLKPQWVLSPNFGLGLFQVSDELDLGSSLEFRTGVELAYRTHHNSRLGLALYHLSNGGFAGTNPGTEVLVISWSLPMAN